MRQDGIVDSYRCRYTYVGEGKGDYAQDRYPIKEKNYTHENPYVKNVSGSNIAKFIDAIVDCYLDGDHFDVSTIRGQLNAENLDEVKERLAVSTPGEIIKLYNKVCSSINTCTRINASSNGFTPAEIALIESQCDQAYENYQYDYSPAELAEVVWNM